MARKVHTSHILPTDLLLSGSSYEHCIYVYITHAGKRRLFAWGRGDYGQLGRNLRTDTAGSSAGSCCPLPTEIPVLSGVRQVRRVEY